MFFQLVVHSSYHAQKDTLKKYAPKSVISFLLFFLGHFNTLQYLFGTDKCPGETMQHVHLNMPALHKKTK